MTETELRERFRDIVRGGDDDDPTMRKILKTLADELEPASETMARRCAPALPAPGPPESEPTTLAEVRRRIKFEERRRDRREAAVRRGELVERAAILAIYERRLVTLMAAIRDGSQAYRRRVAAGEDLEGAALSDFYQVLEKASDVFSEPLFDSPPLQRTKKRAAPKRPGGKNTRK